MSRKAWATTTLGTSSGTYSWSSHAASRRRLAGSPSARTSAGSTDTSRPCARSRRAASSRAISSSSGSRSRAIMESGVASPASSRRRNVAPVPAPTSRQRTSGSWCSRSRKAARTWGLRLRSSRSNLASRYSANATGMFLGCSRAGSAHTVRPGLSVCRPVAFVLPELHFQGESVEHRPRAKVLPQHAGKALEAGVQPLERRQLVEGPVAVATDGLLEGGLELDDVGKIAVPVERVAAKQHLHLVVVAVLVVLRAPVAADEEMSRDEVARDRESIHGCSRLVLEDHLHDARAPRTGRLESFGAAREREGGRDEALRAKGAEQAPRQGEPTLSVPASSQPGIDRAYLARHDAQAIAMKAPAEVDRARPAAVPGADDDARTEARGLDRPVERSHVAGQFEEQVGAPHAVEERSPGIGVPRVHRLLNPPGGGERTPPVQWLDGDEPLERKAREQRRGEQAHHALAEHQHALAHEGRAVEQQVGRGLDQIGRAH